MNLEQLNQKYYYLFNDLFDASPALPERHYNTVAKILEQQYLEELDICLTENILEVGVKNFELKFRARNYLPRRAWLRWNKMAKALLSDYKADFKVFLDSWTNSRKKQHEPIQEVKADDPPKEDSTNLPVPDNKAVAPTEGE